MGPAIEDLIDAEPALILQELGSPDDRLPGLPRHLEGRPRLPAALPEQQYPAPERALRMTAGPGMAKAPSPLCCPLALLENASSKPSGGGQGAGLMRRIAEVRGIRQR